MKNKKSVFTIIKNHYIISIFLPVLIYLDAIIGRTLFIDDNNSFFGKMLYYINDIVFMIFPCIFLFFLLKKEWKSSFVVALTQFFSIIFLFFFINKYKINEDIIFYKINKKEILKMIEKEYSIAQDGKGRLVKIPMNGAYTGCDKYLIYDEIDEMSDPKGNFRGIDYVNINNDIVGYSYHKKAFQVISYYVDKHIYVMYFCLDTGQ